VSDAGAPEWTPIPVTVARAPSVVCLPAFMTPLPQPLGERTDGRRPLLTPQCSSGFIYCAVDVGPSVPYPRQVPFPESLRENLNTGRIAANSRFFSDCYNAPRRASICHDMVFFDHAKCRNVTRYHLIRSRFTFPRGESAESVSNGITPLTRKAMGSPVRPPIAMLRKFRVDGSVRLATQERRDLELIVLDRGVHRRGTAVLVETLRCRPRRGRTLGILRHRLGA